MKAWDFDAVTYEADVYCIECLPEGVSHHSDDCYPIFADSEWDYTPICCVCGCEHDYVTVLQYSDDFPMSLEYDDDNPFEYHDEPDWNDF